MYAHHNIMFKIKIMMLDKVLKYLTNFLQNECLNFQHKYIEFEKNLITIKYFLFRKKNWFSKRLKV